MLKERIEEVTHMNELFYQAFEQLDVALMDSIWAHQEYVTCIHPGWSIRVGWPAVRDSWVVICTENITSRVGENPQNSRVVATNLFERIGDEWKMIHHHGSPLME